MNLRYGSPSDRKAKFIVFNIKSMVLAFKSEQFYCKSEQLTSLAQSAWGECIWEYSDFEVSDWILIELTFVESSNLILSSLDSNHNYDSDLISKANELSHKYERIFWVIKKNCINTIRIKDINSHKFLEEFKIMRKLEIEISETTSMQNLIQLLRSLNKDNIIRLIVNHESFWKTEDEELWDELFNFTKDIDIANNHYFSKYSSWSIHRIKEDQICLKYSDKEEVISLSNLRYFLSQKIKSYYNA